MNPNHNLNNNTTNNSTNTPPYKKFLAIKVPANVLHLDKCIHSLGGIESISDNNIKNTNINFELLDLDLEKTHSNDLLIKRKRKRLKSLNNSILENIDNNKATKPKYKYEYEIVGSIDSIYDYFRLRDFDMSTNQEDKVDDPVKLFQSFLIDKSNSNTDYTNNDPSNSDKLYNDKIKEISSMSKTDKESINKALQKFTMSKCSTRRNNYSYFLKKEILEKNNGNLNMNMNGD